MTSTFFVVKNWRQGKMSRPGRWPNCAYKRTSCKKKTSACEPSWKPAGPNDYESLLAPFLLPVPAMAKRQLHRMISTSRQMMSYHLAVPPSLVVHHPQTPRRPTQEKGRLTGDRRTCFPPPSDGVDRIRVCSQVHNTITKGLLSNPWKTAP